MACGYGRQIETIKYENLYAEERPQEIDDIELALSRWLGEIEGASLDLWLFVT